MDHTARPIPSAAEDIEARYADLQRSLIPLWETIGHPIIGGFTQVQNTVVVVPSLSLDVAFDVATLRAYEERFLCMLFLLRQPNVRLIYITSQAVHPVVVDYYLGLVPGVTVTNARKRLFLASPLEASARPLSRKLLDRPRLLEHIRALIPDPQRAHVVPFVTSELERELAVRLGIPMYAADPRFFAFGTKSGGRRLFAEEGVPHPLGVENLFSEAALVAALAQMRAAKPSLRQVVVKLNEGVSGMGNALLDLGSLPAPGDAGERAALAERLRHLHFEGEGIDYEGYMASLTSKGGIVEERIVGDALDSPSAQLRVTPSGQVELLSSHDQILGGPSGESYLGCRFPARPEYGPLIMREAAKVGRRLAREGIIGRFALDFVVVRNEREAWEAYAIEINLRKGGTTHPFLTLQWLTDGTYDADSGRFTTVRGHNKYYVATDHLESPDYRVFTADNLFDIISRHGLHFDHTAQTGIVLHMMSAVSDSGRLGLTAISDTPAQADALYQKVAAILDEEARAALTPSPLDTPGETV